MLSGCHFGEVRFDACLDLFGLMASVGVDPCAQAFLPCAYPGSRDAVERFDSAPERLFQGVPFEGDVGVVVERDGERSAAPQADEQRDHADRQDDGAGDDDGAVVPVPFLESVGGVGGQDRPTDPEPCGDHLDEDHDAGGDQRERQESGEDSGEDGNEDAQRGFLRFR